MGILMTETNFNELFQTYLDNAQRASESDKAEQQLVGLFRTFVVQGFGVDSGELSQEDSIRMEALNRRGRTDLLVNNLIFEFKRSKYFQIAEREQLKNYLVQANKNSGQVYTGLFTDGVRFEAYRILEDKLDKFDEFNLKDLSPASAFIRVDAYLFTQNNRPPTAEDVVLRYGSSSPAFAQVFLSLRQLLERVKDSPMLAVWRLQWERLLARVYGSNVGDDELFLRHTYLCQFARVLGYAALKRDHAQMPQSDEAVAAILDGSAFREFGVSNISEHDFYSWILMPEIRKEALALFRQLADTLIVYDLGRIDQDLLKQLYQNLVDPKTRHDLGEYYTPDWLAELTLEDINYQAPQSAYDPTCGSGSFLFSALKRLNKLGMKGRELIEFAMNNVVGTDVHPLAVTVARVNYLLALAEHLRDNAAGRTQLLTIPVFMADALLKPLENEGAGALIIKTDSNVKSDEAFRIPYESTRNETVLNELIDLTERFAQNAKNSQAKQVNSEAFQKLLREKVGDGLSVDALNAWTQNLTLLAQLKQQDRNGIWSYILKNLARPLALAQRKFDVIMGNPPWLSYRYIKNKEYQADVKWLYQHYQLLESGDVKLFTQMDLSTLFYALMRDRYLKEGGTIAFVMPRAVITGAKQHRPFQKIGFSRVLDLRRVVPLFNVETCVLIQDGLLYHENVPSIAYTGKLPQHEMDLAAACEYLSSQNTKVNFVDSDVRSPYYYEQFFQGATLVPRNFCFVKPQGMATSPAVMTDPEADKEAKKPYKGQKITGIVGDDFVYATLLSKHLLPFGYEKLHMVALPVLLREGKLALLENEEAFIERGEFETWDWFKAAIAIWERLKKPSTKMSLFERLDYQRTLSKQNPAIPYKVLYNSSGTNISAAVLDTATLSLRVHERKTQGFIVDYTSFFYDAVSKEEAHYLAALLNAPAVSIAIKAYQTRGIYHGERHIQRTPFEACAIPPFDASNPQHAELSALSIAAHEQIVFMRESKPKGGVAALRKLARKLTEKQLKAIDVLAKVVLGLE
jgi:methylase of polypeptide subunit release factors